MNHPLDDIVVSVEHPKANLEGFQMRNYASFSITELPPDPETTTRASPRGPLSVSAKIDPNPKPPVLADGLFVHTERPAPGSFHETDIRLPNINCEKCTLQIIFWMGEHALNRDGDYSYHHCANLKITANPALPIDTTWPGQSSASR